MANPKTMSLAEALARLGLKNEKPDEPAEPLILTDRDGQPAVVLMTYDHYESLMETLEILSDPEELAKIREGEEAIKRGDVVSYEEAFGEPMRTPRETPADDTLSIALTSFDRSVLQHLAFGQSHEDLARSFGLPVVTVEKIVKAVMEKCGVKVAGVSVEDATTEERPAFKTGR